MSMCLLYVLRLIKVMLDLQGENSDIAYKETSKECLTYDYISSSSNPRHVVRFLPLCLSS